MGRSVAGTGRPGWRSGTAMVLFGALVAGAASVPATADAVQGDEPLVPSLSDGTWHGQASAVGGGTATEQGIDFRWDINLDASLAFEVAGDSASGEWEFETPIALTGDGTIDGNKTAMNWSGEVTGGGPVSGNAQHLLLDGSSHNTGTVTIESGGRTFTNPVDNTAAMPTFEVAIIAATCTEAIGDWIFSLETVAAEYGWTPALSGSWSAFRGDAAVIAELSERAEDLYARLQGAKNDLWRASVEGGSAPPDVSSDLNALAHDVERFVNELRAVEDRDDCDGRAYDSDDVAAFFSIATHIVHDIIILAAENFDLDSEWIAGLAGIGYRTGALGAGSVTGIAEIAEAALIADANAIIAEHVAPADDTSKDGEPCEGRCLYLSDELISVLVTGAQYGWTVTIDGTDVAASQVLQSMKIPLDGGTGAGS